MVACWMFSLVSSWSWPLSRLSIVEAATETHVHVLRGQQIHQYHHQYHHYHHQYDSMNRRTKSDSPITTNVSISGPVRLFRHLPLKSSSNKESQKCHYYNNKSKASKRFYKEKGVICYEWGELIPPYSSYFPTSTPDIVDQVATADNDLDGLTNDEELLIGTDPGNADSDGDGLSDSQEVFLGTDPIQTDTDSDGVTDYQEVIKGSDPLDNLSVPDILDSDDTAIKDTDGDGLQDTTETNELGTDPNQADTDGDGIMDGDELNNGLDPLVSNTNQGSGTTQDDGYSPGCDAYGNGETFITDIPAKVKFEYEAKINATYNITNIVRKLDINTARYVGGQLINCETVRKLENNTHSKPIHGRMLQSMVDGVDSNPPDIPTQEACTYFDSDCYLIQGFITLYLRENSAQTSSLESSSKALLTLLTAFNDNDPSPFIQQSGNTDFTIDGLIGVRYMRGFPDEGMQLIDNSGNGEGTVNVGGAISEAENSDTNNDENKSLTSLGVTLISLGSVMLLALALTAMFVGKRKREKKHQKSYAEFLEDDENDLDKGWNEQDIDPTVVDTSSVGDGSPSITSTKKNRLVHIHGEDESVFSSYTTDIIRDLHASEAAALAAQVSEEPQTFSGPIFVQTYDDDFSHAYTNDMGFEYSFDQSQQIYSPRENLRKPTYENPAGIGMKQNKRSYAVDDTVEF